MTTLYNATYHRAGGLGDGAFGCVVTVYNDEGSQFASKSFGDEEDDEDDEKDGTMDLGLIREVSILRLLMVDVLAHPNILPLHDITTVNDIVSLVMPMYPMNIGKAIETSAYSDKGTKIRIAFELLSALCHLHDNSIIHRDVKPDNIMMDENDRPILIDFSLCKVLKPQETATAETHTGNIGTACYISPECYNSVPYSYEADSYSVGVVLLELFKGTLLTDTVGRDKAALVAVQNMVKDLPANPFPDVIRGLCETDGAARLTCREAMAAEVFKKNKMLPPAVDRQFENALEALHPTVADENEAPAKGKKRRAAVTSKGSSQQLSKAASALGVLREQTVSAAREYCEKSEGVDVQYCLILAMKIYEECLTEYEDCEGYLEEAGLECDLDVYCSAEREILRAMNYCLFVGLVDGEVQEAGKKKKKGKGKK